MSPPTCKHVVGKGFLPWHHTIKYSGQYTGEISNGVPNGYGIFTTDEESTYQFTYKGKFKEGLFQGKGTVTLNDDSIFSCKFVAGVPHGKGVLSYPNGNYKMIRYNMGFPFHEVITYSASGDVLNQDFYFDSETISSLKSSSEIVAYRDLLVDSERYYGHVIFLECDVINVFETQTSCVFKVKDRDGNIYWGDYGNTLLRTYDQTILPTLHEGDSLELYAFSVGVGPYAVENDEEHYHYYFPKLLPITGIVNDTDFSYKNANDSYEEMLSFPFHYMKRQREIVGTVENVIDTSSLSYIKIMSDDGNLYYVYYDNGKVNDEISEDFCPVMGDRIQVEGKCFGLYKEYSLETKDYSQIFPLIKLSSAEVIDNNRIGNGFR